MPRCTMRPRSMTRGSLRRRAAPRSAKSWVTSTAGTATLASVRTSSSSPRRPPVLASRRRSRRLVEQQDARVPGRKGAARSATPLPLSRRRSGRVLRSARCAAFRRRSRSRSAWARRLRVPGQVGREPKASVAPRAQMREQGVVLERMPASALLGRAGRTARSESNNVAGRRTWSRPLGRRRGDRLDGAQDGALARAGWPVRGRRTRQPGTSRSTSSGNSRSSDEIVARSI